jgi:hypothetical protein
MCIAINLSEYRRHPALPADTGAVPVVEESEDRGLP